MLTVYEVFDNRLDGDQGRYFRNLKEARQEFAGVERGRIDRITIRTPITKDLVIALLNQEGYAVKQETIAEKC
jgi:hypothetical protein